MSDNNTQRWSKLMQDAQRGDAKAYQKLLNEISPVLKAFLAKRLYNQNDVDDVLQDVLIGIHKARHTYQPNKPFHAWMFAIARYKTIDALRKAGRKQEFETASFDEFETFLGQAPKAIAKLEQKELRDELVNAIKSLNDKQQTVVHMLKIKGYSVKQTAKATGMSVPAVKTTAHRAYKRLRKILNEKR